MARLEKAARVFSPVPKVERIQVLQEGAFDTAEQERPITTEFAIGWKTSKKRDLAKPQRPEEGEDQGQLPTVWKGG